MDILTNVLGWKLFRERIHKEIDVGKYDKKSVWFLLVPLSNGDLYQCSNALLVKAHWEGDISELYLSFYPRPNIADRFRSHFIRIQIFQIDFHLILYL